MPYVDESLPFQGSTPLSRHCSAEGAKDAQPRACGQTRRYLLLLADREGEGATDLEAARMMGVERSTINARRVPLTKGDRPWVESDGVRKGPTGVNNCVWKLTGWGWAAVHAIKAAR